MVDYVDQIVGDNSAGEAPAEILVEFSVNLDHARDVDVIHLTDVSRAIGGPRLSDDERTRRASRFVRLLRRKHIALVRTVSQEDLEHSRSRAEQILDRAAAALISLTPPALPSDRDPVVIAHSHLRDRFLGFPRGERVDGRILVAARGALPATYEPVLKVFAAANLPGWTLRIAGSVSTNLQDSFARTVADHPERISLRDEEISDAAAVEEVSRAEVIIVTAPESYEAQSIIMLALSLDRPILVEDSETIRSLADEVGPTWVRRHRGLLTAYQLETALAELRNTPPLGRPNLDSRAPNAISAQYMAIYRAAALGH